MALNSLQEDNYTFVGTSVANCSSSTESCVEFYGCNGSKYCGYCKKSSGGRISTDMDAKTLTVSHYEQLLDRSWRRCGEYCYQPANKKSCCPCYPISVKALEFQFQRSLRKCVEKVNLFLETGSTEANNSAIVYSTSAPKPKSKCKTIRELETSPKAKHRRFIDSCRRKERNLNIPFEIAVSDVRAKHESRRRPQPILEDYLYPKRNTSNQTLTTKHRLHVEMNFVSSQRAKSLYRDEHEMIVKYQQTIHKEEASDWTMPRFATFLIVTPLIRESLNNFDFLNDEQPNDSMSINIDYDDSYLIVKPPPVPTCYGTYHCHYFLNNKLIAVGVLDVLPKYITSVYFFYDPDYSNLNLGMYSALVEISMIRRMNNHYIGNEPNKLIYYHLGFFVHESPKMHYKLRFNPSSMLCSETHTYIETKKCLEKLQNAKYARFSDSNVSIRHPVFDDMFLVKLEISSLPSIRSPLYYIDWLRRNIKQARLRNLFQDCLLNYVSVVGPKLASEMILKIDYIHRILVTRDLFEE